MIRALVVDDEPLAREHLIGMLKADANVEVVGEARNGVEAIEMAGETSPDVIFLDIEMPGMTGFDVVRNLNNPPLIVFATAYDEYAVPAFEANAIDYLLKPIQPGRVRLCLDKLRAALGAGRGRQREAMDEMLSVMTRQKKAPPAKLAGRKGRRIVLLGLREVLRISIEDKLVFAHTAADRFLLDKTITQMEAMLAEVGFLRISRADLVNLEHVRELIPWGAGAFRVQMRSGEELDVSRDRTRILKDQLGIGSG